MSGSALLAIGVRKVLDEHGGADEVTPEGFELGPWRIRRSSGIASPGRWLVVRVRGGDCRGSAGTMAELRALLCRCPGVRCRTCHGHGSTSYRRNTDGDGERTCRRCAGTGYEAIDGGIVRAAENAEADEANAVLEDH